jgi:hypothetical protein
LLAAKLKLRKPKPPLPALQQPANSLDASILSAVKARGIELGDDDDYDVESDEEFVGGGNRSESPYIDYNTDDKNTTGLLMVGGTMLSEYWKQITIVLCILALLYIIYLIYTENKKYSEYINYQAEYNPYNNSCTSIF